MTRINFKNPQRAQRILNIATELFLAQGFKETSLDKIIEKSGGSKRAIYEEFGNKDNLFICVVENMLQGPISSLDELEQSNDDVEKTLKKVAKKFIKALISPNSIKLLRMVIAEIDRFPDLGIEVFSRGPDRAYQALSQYFSNASIQKKLAIQNSRVAAEIFIEMLKTDIFIRMLLQPYFSVKESDLDNKINIAIEIFLYGTLIHAK